MAGRVRDVLEQDPVHDEMVWAFLNGHEQYSSLRWIHAVRMRRYAAAADLLRVDASNALSLMDRKVAARLSVCLCGWMAPQRGDLQTALSLGKIAAMASRLATDKADLEMRDSHGELAQPKVAHEGGHWARAAIAIAYEVELDIVEAQQSVHHDLRKLVEDEPDLSNATAQEMADYVLHEVVADRVPAGLKEVAPTTMWQHGIL